MVRPLLAEPDWQRICDFTLATPEAKFGFTEVRIGFVPALVSAFLSLQVGDKRSRDLLLTGRLFGAAEAQQLGLVNEVVEPEELVARAHALAKSLLANSPQSISATKQLLAAQNRSWLDSAIVAALQAIAESREICGFSRRSFGFSGEEKAGLEEVSSAEMKCCSGALLNELARNAVGQFEHFET